MSCYVFYIINIMNIKAFLQYFFILKHKYSKTRTVASFSIFTHIYIKSETDCRTKVPSQPECEAPPGSLSRQHCWLM